MIRFAVILTALCLTGCVGMQTPKTLEINEQVLFSWDGWAEASASANTNSYRSWRWNEWTRYDRNGDGRVDLVERAYKSSWLIYEVWDDSKRAGFFDRHYYRAGDGSRYRVLKVHVVAPEVPPQLK